MLILAAKFVEDWRKVLRLGVGIRFLRDHFIHIENSENIIMVIFKNFEHFKTGSPVVQKPLEIKIRSEILNMKKQGKRKKIA